MLPGEKHPLTRMANHTWVCWEFFLHSLMGSKVWPGCTDCTRICYTVHCSVYNALLCALFCSDQFTQFKLGLNMFVSLGKHILLPGIIFFIIHPISCNDVTFIFVSSITFPSFRTPATRSLGGIEGTVPRTGPPRTSLETSLMGASPPRTSPRISLPWTSPRETGSTKLGCSES